MRCRTCDYSLWTVTGRTCPECGSGFLPSDYTFVPGTVRFECPHCRAGYVGTSPTGHLLPRSFACTECHAQIDMDEMVLVPLAGMAERSTLHSRNRWEDRGDGALLLAWGSSTRDLLFRPTSFASTLERHRSTGQAWLFAAIGWLMAVVVGALLSLSIGPGAISPFWLIASTSPTPSMDPVLHVAFGSLIVLAGFAAVTLIGAVLQHIAVLFLVRDRSPFSATMRAALFASGASAVPFVFGWLVPPFTCFCLPLLAAWWFVPSCILLTHVHRTSLLRGMTCASTAIGAALLTCAGAMGWGVMQASAGVRAAVAAFTPPGLPPGAVRSPGFNPLSQYFASVGYQVPNGKGILGPDLFSQANTILWPQILGRITEDGSVPVTLAGIDLAAVQPGDTATLSAIRTAALARIPTLPARLGSLVVYGGGGTGDFNDWVACWRQKDGNYGVTTLFAEFTMTPAEFDQFVTAEVARRAAAGSPMVHPNKVLDVADTSTTFLPDQPPPPDPSDADAAVHAQPGGSGG